ncbi:TPA: hypothetical protein I7730_00520 [Vibrio vulnificus]|uniref:Beta sliding clamp n=1 Tax=Vibrio vulnificus TaxID=672 RepID=A0A8H9K6R1_VIBVL|nr:hypothetical protein [Vibrio vulnificus]
MKLSITVSILKSLLKRVDDSVKSSVQKRPQHSSVLIRCSEKGSYLAGVNPESTVQVIIPPDEIEDFEEGVICAPMKKLTQIIDKYQPTSTITITKLDEYSSQVKQGRSRQKLSCIKSSEFSYSPSSDKLSAILEINRKEFASALDIAASVADKNHVNPRLKGVSLKATANTFRVAASDGYRVAKANLSGSFDAEFEKLIPQESAVAIAKVASRSKSGTVNVGFSSNSCIISTEGLTLSTKLIDSNPIDYDKFIVEKGIPVSIYKDVLLRAANLALTILKDTKYPVITLEIGKATLNIKAKGINGIDAMHTELDCMYEREPYDVAINPLYLKEAIEGIPESVVNIIYDPSNSPVVSVLGAKSKSVSHHIMPVKI